MGKLIYVKSVACVCRTSTAGLASYVSTRTNVHESAAVWI